jgi:hypothetical protein
LCWMLPPRGRHTGQGQSCPRRGVRCFGYGCGAPRAGPACRRL